MNTAGIIAVASLLIFIYFATLAHWFDVILFGEIKGYNDHVSQARALIALAWLIGFIIRNEIEKRGGGGGGGEK